MITGGCLCGGVKFEIDGPLRGVVNCHCTMCQKLNGGFGGHTRAKTTDVKFISDESLKWYNSSPIAKRGFCSTCGASLFWNPAGEDTTSILAGVLDLPTNLMTAGHIFVEEKPDYYEITDNLPQFGKSSNGGL